MVSDLYMEYLGIYRCKHKKQQQDVYFIFNDTLNVKQCNT